MPLSTLHPAPRGTQRKTRGQDGSLLLSRGALSSPTARRFIPTIARAYARGSDRSRDRGSGCLKYEPIYETVRLERGFHRGQEVGFRGETFEAFDLLAGAVED